MEAVQTTPETKAAKQARKALKKATNNALGCVEEKFNEAGGEVGNALEAARAYSTAVKQLTRTRPELGDLAVPQQVFELLQRAQTLLEEHGRQLLKDAEETLFPGRRARWDARSEAAYQDRTTATLERYAGHSGE